MFGGFAGGAAVVEGVLRVFDLRRRVEVGGLAEDDMPNELQYHGTFIAHSYSLDVGCCEEGRRLLL